MARTRATTHNRTATPNTATHPPADATDTYQPAPMSVPTSVPADIAPDADVLTTFDAPALAAAPTITITRLILHGLDPRQNSIRLVDEAVILDEQSARFFAEHVAAAEQRADWRASFQDDASEVPLLCRQLLADVDAFVAASQQLAQRLYDQMRPRAHAITPGDFVAVVYTRHGETEQRAALLKLDPDHRLMREFRRANGHLRVTIRAAENLLPDIIRLQKCALLLPRGDTFEMTLLDTQAGPRSDGVAAFFYRGFLTARLAPSARRRTRLFITNTDTWLARHERLLSPQQTLTFYRARRAVLAGDTVQLRPFAAAALPDHPTQAEELARTLRAALLLMPSEPDAFAVDRATADPFVRYVTLELDGGTRLRLAANRFDELVSFGPQRTDGKIALIINTLTFREVSGL